MRRAEVPGAAASAETRAAGATRLLADWIAAPHSLPDPTVAMAKRCLLDWLGAGFAGSTRPAGEIAARIAAHLRGPAESTLLSGGRAGCATAALANGIASHAVEMDDLHRPSVMHLGTVTIPASLALAERSHCPGHRLLDAIVCGYEVGARVAEAAGTAHYRFWHVTGTAGTLAAAGAAAVVLGLSPEKTLFALGSAGTLCAGLWEFLEDGAMSKPLHAGRAAETGVLCGLLAQEGFTGASAILEGEKGFLRAMAGGGAPDRLTQGLGERFMIDNNSFKLHAACGHSHPAIDAALLLRQRGVPPSGIERIRVRTFRVALEVMGIREPANPYQAKFSLPFCVALAFSRGRVGVGEFTPATLADPEIQALAGRVDLEEDDAATRAFPDRWQAVVSVARDGGRHEEARVDVPRGSPENPASDDELRSKFADLTAGILTPTRRNALIEAVSTIETAPDVAAIPWGRR